MTRGCVLTLVFLCLVQCGQSVEFCPFKVKSYTGCYSDNDSQPSFVAHNASDPTISPVTAAQCACKCGNQEYQYSAIQNLNECYCSNSFNTSAKSTGCVNNCIDNTTNACGGFDDGTTSVYSVYKTTVGCDPACVNSTCTLYDKSFYMCTPSCEFSANFIYDIPCTTIGQVTLNMTSSNFHGTNFTYTLDGGPQVSAVYNVPITFQFQVSVTHTFVLRNRFGCVVTKNITLPAATIPTKNHPVSLTFDPATMSLESKYYQLLFPSETGNVKLHQYEIDYRYKCPDTGSYSNWISQNNTDISGETISVPFQYALQYDVRVYSTNCVGTSVYSDEVFAVAPNSPYIPTVFTVLPTSLPTTGGLLTITGIYFSSTPKLYLDGVAVTALSGSASQATFQIGEGQGTHGISVQSFANYTCQQVTSSAFSWSYAAPNVTSTSVLSNAGGNLIIYGNNFGVVGANVTATIDEIPCGACQVTQAHTTISCNSCPAGTGGDHHLAVQVAGTQSSFFSFTYAICDPFCIFGECVANNVCQCEDGYGDLDCSAVHICSDKQTPSLGNTCGDCTDSTVCCQFSSLA